MYQDMNLLSLFCNDRMLVVVLDQAPERKMAC